MQKTLSEIYELEIGYNEPTLGCPYKNLIVAVIERAIQDLFGKEERVKRESLEWFEKDEGASELEVFSFAWCLDQLGYLDNLEHFKRKILSLEEFKMSKHKISYGPLSFKRPSTEQRVHV